MEPLTTVIMPTIESLEAAIRTYEWQGGSATIIVCDDGMQVCEFMQHMAGYVAVEAVSREQLRQLSLLKQRVHAGQLSSAMWQLAGSIHPAESVEGGHLGAITWQLIMAL